MAAAPKALLLLGVLAALLVLSSPVTGATKDQNTETADAAAVEHAVIEDKQAQPDVVCSNCCRFVKRGFWLTCVRCCGAGEEGPAQFADAIVDNKRICRCCHYLLSHGVLRCVHYCCPDGEKVAAEPKEKPQN